MQGGHRACPRPRSPSGPLHRAPLLPVCSARGPFPPHPTSASIRLMAAPLPGGHPASLGAGLQQGTGQPGQRARARGDDDAASEACHRVGQAEARGG